MRVEVKLNDMWYEIDKRFKTLEDAVNHIRVVSFIKVKGCDWTGYIRSRNIIIIREI